MTQKPYSKLVERAIGPIVVQTGERIEKECEPELIAGRKDPMVGKEVLITKGPLVEIEQVQLDGSRKKQRRHYPGSLYHGYVGTIKSVSDGLNMYNVHLEANGAIVQVQKDLVADRW